MVTRSGDSEPFNCLLGCIAPGVSANSETNEDGGGESGSSGGVVELAAGKIIVIDKQRSYGEC